MKKRVVVGRMCARYTLTPEQAKLVIAGLVHSSEQAPCSSQRSSLRG